MYIKTKCEGMNGMSTPVKRAQQVLDELLKNRFLPFQVMVAGEVIVEDEFVLCNSVLSNLYLYFENSKDVKISIPSIEHVSIIHNPKLHISIQANEKYEIKQL